jgi:hypothetical protein
MSSKVSHLVAKPMLAGVVSSAVNQVMYPATSLVVGSSEIPMWQIGGVVGATANLTAELVHEYIFASIPTSNRLFENTYTEAIAVAVNAGTSALLYNASNSNALASIGLTSILIDSAISQVGADWVYDRFVSPMIQTYF